MTTDGYMLVSDLLQFRDFEGFYGEEDVIRIVENNDKKRFELNRDDSGRLRVRANQGHTMEVSILYGMVDSNYQPNVC